MPLVGVATVPGIIVVATITWTPSQIHCTGKVTLFPENVFLDVPSAE
jgi:hypothetical protein